MDEAWEWIGNVVLHFIRQMINYSCWSNDTMLTSVKTTFPFFRQNILQVLFFNKQTIILEILVAILCHLEAYWRWIWDTMTVLSDLFEKEWNNFIIVPVLVKQPWRTWLHHADVIMGAMASQITSLTIVYSTVYAGEDQRKHQSSASLAFVRGIHRGPVNSPHKWPVTRKMFPFDHVIMEMQKHGLMYNVEPLRFDITKTKKSLQHRVGILYDILYIISQNIVSVDTSVSSILGKWLTLLSAKYTFPCDAHQAYFHIEAAKNDRHYASDIFKCHFLKEDLRISIRISLKFAPEGPIDINSSLVQIMARHRMNGRKTTIWTNGGLMYSVEIS